MGSTRIFPFRRVASVPVTMQMETMECGAACLRMVLACYGRFVSLAELRTVCGTGRSGTSIKRIMKAAMQYGLTCDAYSMTAEALQKEKQLPMILFYKGSHYVVLRGFRFGKAVINDPAQGMVQVRMADFERDFSGIAISFAPADNFQKGGSDTDIRGFVFKNLKNARPEMALTLCITAIGLICAFLQPGFSEAFLDDILSSVYRPWAIGFLCSFLLIAAAQTLGTALRSKYWLKIEGKLAITASAGFMWHVLHLPVEFFLQRQTADLLMRSKANESLASTVMAKLLPTVMNGILVVIYVLVMVRYHVGLTLVGLGLVLLNLLLSVVAARIRINDARAAAGLSARLYGSTVSGIHMAESLKACGAETKFFGRWVGYQAASNRQNAENELRSTYLSAFSGLIQSLSNVIVLICGMYLVTRRQFTVGRLMAFHGLMNAMIAPANSITEARQTLKEMRTDTERVGDVLEYPQQASLHTDTAAPVCTQPLSGAVEIKNVSFGYTPVERKRIRNVSLRIAPGEKLALVGASGCGKSTLCKLITGLYDVTEGEILFDGFPVTRIDRDVWSRSVAVVEPEGKLFRDTVRNNICMWDDTIDSARVMEAAKTALIHDEIMKRPGGYDYSMEAEGADFSGGQRQRLAIARALVRRPSLLIPDEATSALDANTEAAVMENIYALGITCIIVAHRLSTIRTCDRILVFSDGCIAEEGTHETLLAANGLYRRLIENN